MALALPVFPPHQGQRHWQSPMVSGESISEFSYFTRVALALPVFPSPSFSCPPGFASVLLPTRDNGTGRASGTQHLHPSSYRNAVIFRAAHPGLRLPNVVNDANRQHHTDVECCQTTPSCPRLEFPRPNLRLAQLLVSKTDRLPLHPLTPRLIRFGP